MRWEECYFPYVVSRERKPAQPGTFPFGHIEDISLIQPMFPVTFNTA